MYFRVCPARVGVWYTRADDLRCAPGAGL